MLPPPNFALVRQRDCSYRDIGAGEGSFPGGKEGSPHSADQRTRMFEGRERHAKKKKKKRKKKKKEEFFLTLSEKGSR